jgi:hypothetical protein
MRNWAFAIVLLAGLSPFCSGATALRPGQDSSKQLGGQTIPCSSEDGEKHYCEADTRNGAHLLRQSSKAECKEGESWGYDEEGIWVDKGCGGEFALGRAAEATDAPGESSGQTISCASEDGRRKVCAADTNNGVQLVRQRSDAKCREGSSWGHDARGIWVDKGCAGDFVVKVPGHPTGSPTQARRSEIISCMSFDGRKNYCETDTQGAKVTLTRQIGTANCTEGSTWGVDRRGIWVDRGCSGEFLVQPGDDFSPPPTGKGCEKTVGRAVADELVRRCLQVSSAKPTPCKAQNSCKVLEDEIQRGCELLGAKAPAYCGKD